MTEGAPRPETESTPEGRFFNVDAMSNEQITVLWRSLAGAAYNMADELHFGESHSPELSHVNLDVCDGLWQTLVREMHDWAERDSERVKALIESSVQSQESLDRELAARVSPGLIHHDYEFTRDVMVFLSTTGDRAPEGPATGVWSEIAGHCTAILMRDHLAPEQIADFNAHLTAHGEWHEIDPASPGVEYWAC